MNIRKNILKGLKSIGNATVSLIGLLVLLCIFYIVMFYDSILNELVQKGGWWWSVISQLRLIIPIGIGIIIYTLIRKMVNIFRKSK